MPTVCLLLPHLSPGDAVGHDVIGMFRVLQEKGIEVHLLAQGWEPHISLPVEPFEHYEEYAQRPDVVSIYHHSASWERGYRRFLAAAGPKVLRYHNVTPFTFFAPYSLHVATDAYMGRKQTEALMHSNRIDLFLGASRYNLHELEALGAPSSRCYSLPPFHVLQDLSNIPASVPLLERYLDKSYNVLFLGRVVPNKGHRHVLGVLAAFRQLFSRPLRLFIVGERNPHFHTYHEELYALAKGLRIADSVVWTGKVGPEELKAYFLLTHVFLVMSEHEGFCVPVIEAMAYNIPVVAYAAGAVTETVGDAGVVIQGLDYDHYAAALELLFSRPDLRETLIARQQRRLAEHFAAPVLAQKFWELIAPLLR